MTVNIGGKIVARDATTLTVPRGTWDLSELVHLPHLRTLDVQFTAVRRLDGLEGLHALETLNLTGSPVKDLGPIASLTSLTTLNLDGTVVEDTSPIAGLTQLRTVTLGRQTRSLDALGGLPHLQNLEATCVKVDGLSSLAPLTALRTLVLGGATQLRSLEGIEGCTELQHLMVGATSIDDLEPLRGLRRLEVLHIHNTAVSSLEPLRDHPCLRELSAAYTQVSDPSPLYSVRTLQEVDLSRCPVDLTEMRIALPSCKVLGPPQPQVRTRLVLGGDGSSISLDEDESGAWLEALTPHIERQDSPAADDESRWHERLLRRFSLDAPPGADQDGYWRRYIRLNGDTRVVAGPSIPNYALDAEGPWLLGGSHLPTLRKTAQDAGLRDEVLTWLAKHDDVLCFPSTDPQ